ncbi:MAG: hypothetical protein PHC75_08640, partial [Burkholderiales bacterium]|nr:hypothetical protein [Burkholderiales bacterium]
MKNQLYIIGLLSLSMIGCANNPFSSYSTQSSSRLAKIYTGNLDGAMEAESTNDILYNMEYGTVQRLKQNYEVSNIYFARSQNSIDVWAASWQSTTFGELSSTMMSMLINDNVNDYQPRGYEKTFLTTLHALNHLDLNNMDDARVEIKRMYQIEQAIQNYNQVMYNQAQTELKKETSDAAGNYVYKEILKSYDFSDINSPQVLALKNSYQNAFSHYLAGFVFEALNEPSLARPGYVKAGQLQPTNPLIQQSIDNLDKNVRPKKNTTDLLIVQEIGHAPQIKSKEINIPISFGNQNQNQNQNQNAPSCTAMINIFYPTMIKDSLNQAMYGFNLDNKPLNPSQMVDVDLMTARSLSDGMPHIIARNIASAVRNIATAKSTCSSGGNLGALLSLGAGIGSIFIDKADERNWNLLPSKVNINRINLPYGNHSFDITINGVRYTKQINLNQP